MILMIFFAAIVIISVAVIVLCKVFDKKWDYYNIIENKYDRQILEKDKKYVPVSYFEKGPDSDGTPLFKKEINELKAKRDEAAAIKKKYAKLCDIFDLTNWCGVISISFSCAFSIVLLICSLVILSLNSPRVVNKTMAKLTMERESLVYRLESQQEIGNEYLYNDINEFNAKISDYKYDRANPWISCFTPEEYSNIEMIDYK